MNPLEVLALMSVMRRLVECMTKMEYKSADWQWCFDGLQTCERVLASMLDKEKSQWRNGTGLKLINILRRVIQRSWKQPGTHKQVSLREAGLAMLYLVLWIVALMWAVNQQ